MYPKEVFFRLAAMWHQEKNSLFLFVRGLFVGLMCGLSPYICWAQPAIVTCDNQNTQSIFAVIFKSFAWQGSPYSVKPLIKRDPSSIGKEVWGDGLSVLFLMSSLNDHFYRCYCWREVFFCLFFNALFTSGSDLFSQKTGYKQKHLQWRCGVKDDRSWFVTKEFSVEKQLLFSDVTRLACISSFWKWSR